MLMKCLLLRIISKPFWDHVWPSFNSSPSKARKFSRLDQNGLKPMSMEYLLFRIMARKCLDHGGTMFSVTSLQEQIELFHYQDCIKWENKQWHGHGISYLVTYQGHIWTRLQLIWINFGYCFHSARAMFGQCGDNVCSRLIFRLARAIKSSWQVVMVYRTWP